MGRQNLFTLAAGASAVLRVGVCLLSLLVSVSAGWFWWRSYREKDGGDREAGESIEWVNGSRVVLNSTRGIISFNHFVSPGVPNQAPLWDDNAYEPSVGGSRWWNAAGFSAGEEDDY